MSTSDASVAEKERLSQKISKLDSEIEELTEQLDALKREKQKLQKEINKIDYQENTEATLNLITELTEANSIEVKLNHDSKTTPIFDRFYHSNKIFLILKNFAVASYRIEQQTSAGNTNSVVRKRVSLIITTLKSIVGTVYVKDRGLTITDLKLTSSLYPRNTERRERLSALAEEIGHLDLTYHEKGRCIPFRNICRFGAQIFRNQTGYGSEYHGEELVREGTLYGETTGFLIIGVRIEN